MQFFTKGMLTAAVTGMLAGCGGGGSSDDSQVASVPTKTQSVSLTGLIAGADTSSGDQVVRLYAGEKLLASGPAEIQPGEYQPRYTLDVSGSAVDNHTPLSLVAVHQPSASAGAESLSAQPLSSQTAEEQELFTTRLGTMARLKANDANRDGFITHQEHLPLTLSATNMLFSELDKSAQLSAREIIQQHGRDRVMAIAALLHSVSDPADTKTSARLHGLGMSLQALTGKLLNSASLQNSQTSTDWLQHASTAYEDITSDKQLPSVTKEHITKTHTEMINLSYNNVLRDILDSSYPSRTLTLRGKVAQGLIDPQVSLQLGAYANNPNNSNSHYDDSARPERPVKLPLVQQGDNRTTRRVPAVNNQFEFSVTLTDTAESFTSCQPSGAGVSIFANPGHPSDNMQDLLTVIVEDLATGIEMRSHLGAFCELAGSNIDTNGDGMVTTKEFPRLNISFEHAAHALLTERSSLTSYGSASGVKPVSQLAIAQLMTQHRQDYHAQIEALSVIMAMQIASYTDASLPAPDSSFDFFATTASLLGLDYGKPFRMYATNNIVPDAHAIIEQLNNLADIRQTLSDSGISLGQLLTRSAKQLSVMSQFGQDQTNAENITKGHSAWLPETSIDGLASVCRDKFTADQIRGIAVRGQGLNKTATQGWLTLDWTASNSREYTVYWDTKPFTAIADAARHITSTTPQVTIRGLIPYTRYYFRIGHQGEPSHPFDIYLGGAGLVNTTADEDTGCDLMTGLAHNSNADGLKSMSFLKVDQHGQRLKRQDRPYQEQPHHCSVEAKHGRTWAVPNTVADNEDRIRHWYGIDNRYVHGDHLEVGDDQFNGFCVDTSGSVYRQDKTIHCTVAKAVERANQQNYCGISDWRLPTYAEITNILELEDTPPGQFDNAFFPNLDNTRLWIKQASPHVDTHAFYIQPNTDTRSIDSGIAPRKQPHQLMLVSDGLQLSAQ